MAPYTFELVFKQLSFGFTGKCMLANTPQAKTPLPFRWLPDRLTPAPEGVYGFLGFLQGVYAVVGIIIFALVLITWSGVVRRIRPSQGLRG